MGFRHVPHPLSHHHVQAQRCAAVWRGNESAARASVAALRDRIPHCFFWRNWIDLAFLLVVDPYDTGRFPTPLPTGVVDIERRTATVSRGRDPRFNAAIFGNSRTFMLDPSSPRPPD